MLETNPPPAGEPAPSNPGAQMARMSAALEALQRENAQVRLEAANRDKAAKVDGALERALGGYQFTGEKARGHVATLLRSEYSFDADQAGAVAVGRDGKRADVVQAVTEWMRVNGSPFLAAPTQHFGGKHVEPWAPSASQPTDVKAMSDEDFRSFVRAGIKGTFGVGGPALHLGGQPHDRPAAMVKAAQRLMGREAPYGSGNGRGW